MNLFLLVFISSIFPLFESTLFPLIFFSLTFSPWSFFSFGVPDSFPSFIISFFVFIQLLSFFLFSGVSPSLFSSLLFFSQLGHPLQLSYCSFSVGDSNLLLLSICLFILFTAVSIFSFFCVWRLISV